MFTALLPLALGGFLRRDRSAACLRGSHQARVGIADGYSRVGCLQDASPDSVRVSYGDAVDNGMVPGYNNRDMSPDQCFQFCRDKTGARFFLIAHGRDCYCAEYYHDVSTGGGGCDLPCEGDTTQKCGGAVKASAFEMHTCGTNTGLAASAASSALENGEKAHIASQRANETHGKMMSLADSWQLPICSKAAQICELRAQWEDTAQQVYDAGLRAGVASRAATEAVTALHSASAGENATTDAAGMLAVEQGIAACREAMSQAAVKTTVVEMAMQQAAGPLQDAAPLAEFDTLFTTTSKNQAKGWTTICDLTPLEGKNMLAVGAPNPSGCADLCVAAGDDCVGFNYQSKDSIFACQLLSDEGVFEQDDAIRDAFGVFEFSNTKVEAMGLDAMDCMVKSAFLVRDGGLTMKVLETVYLEA